MQNLKDHFNRHARLQRKHRKAERQREIEFLILWLFFLIAERERTRRVFERLFGPP